MSKSYLHYLNAYVRSFLSGRRQQKLFDEVETYCMFLGHGRSGHSLVGSLLNAHPEAVIAHELDAFYYVERGINRNQLYYLILERDQWFTTSGSQWTEYNYAVPKQWQGRFKKLRLIGDKKGGKSSQRLREHPEMFGKLKSMIKVPLRIVHVIRNPYDNITTMTRRSNRPLSDSIEKYFRICETNEHIMLQCQESEVITLRHEDVIEDPARELKRVWDFLKMDCEEDYLKDCADIVHKSPSKTRLKVEWPEHLKEEVAARMQPFSFLKGYTF